MLNIVVYSVELLICFLLQQTVFSTVFSIGNIVPDLIVILVIAIAYQKGKVYGMFFGIAGGLMLDLQLTNGSLIGVYALAYLFIAYLAGFMEPYYIKSDTLLPLAMIAVGELFFSFYGYVVNRLISGDLQLLYYIRRIMLPRICYTVIIGIVLYKLFDYIYDSILAPKTEEESPELR